MRFMVASDQKGFQHTAARRRLQYNEMLAFGMDEVSTHSRPKAAGRARAYRERSGSFNTQPPEGGCEYDALTTTQINVSTHSRPKAAVVSTSSPCCSIAGFNTQPPEGG